MLGLESKTASRVADCLRRSRRPSPQPHLPQDGREDTGFESPGKLPPPSSNIVNVMDHQFITHCRRALPSLIIIIIIIIINHPHLFNDATTDHH